MGQRYLIDSNVIIDYTANRLPKNGSDFIENILNEEFLISIATKIEVLGFDDISSKLDFLEEFLNSATVYALDESISNQCIHLRRKHKKLKLGDAIIASTAFVHNLSLATRNVNDFKSIEGLKILNPWGV